MFQTNGGKPEGVCEPDQVNRNKDGAKSPVDAVSLANDGNLGDSPELRNPENRC